MGAVYRIQDAQGRGPWRPGFSSKWMTKKTPTIGIPIMEELGAAEAVKLGHKMGLHLGCAFREGCQSIWFTDDDLRALHRLGFTMREASNCRVLFETDQQVLIGSFLPLSLLPFAKTKASA